MLTSCRYLIKRSNPAGYDTAFGTFSAFHLTYSLALLQRPLSGVLVGLCIGSESTDAISKAHRLPCSASPLYTTATSACYIIAVG
jgi:hypothetical protein